MNKTPNNLHNFKNQGADFCELIKIFLGKKKKRSFSSSASAEEVAIGDV